MNRTVALAGAGALALVVLTLPPSLQAQQPAPRPGRAVLEPYVVGTATPPVDSGGTAVSMTLQQAVDRALEANLDIQSARLSPEIQAQALNAAEAAFSPTFNTTVGYNNASSQSTSQLDGGMKTTSERNTINTSVTQDVPWYGGRLSATFNNSRTATNNTFSVRNPSYSSVVSLSYTQPLLSGLRTDNQRAAVATQEIQRDIADVQLESQIANVTDQVKVAYWNLRSRIEQVEIQRRSLEQARQLLADNRIRVQLGRMAEIEVVQAEAQVASAEQALLNAQIQWQNQELAFKQLLVSGPEDPLFGQTIDPVDQPRLEFEPVDIDAAVEKALRGRTDIEQERRRRHISEIDLDVTRESALPDLSVSAGYALQGVGGDLFDRSGLGGEAQLVQRGGYLDGLRSIADFDTPTWNVSLNFSYPLGMKAAKANVERAELQMRQSDLALKSLELSITTEVTNAGLAVRNAQLQLEAATRSRQAAERAAEAEIAKFNVGASTNFQVVSAQNALTSARLAELQAIIDGMNAVAEFERVQTVGR